MKLTPRLTTSALSGRGQLVGVDPTQIVNTLHSIDEMVDSKFENFSRISKHRVDSLILGHAIRIDHIHEQREKSTLMSSIVLYIGIFSTEIRDGTTLS